jgi:carbonic anhydrase
LIDNWIRHIKNNHRLNDSELNQITNPKAKHDRFVDLNVIEQVNDLAKTSIVQGARNNNQKLSIHGWVYDVGTGIVKDLGVNFNSDDGLSDVYQLNFK